MIRTGSLVFRLAAVGLLALLGGCEGSGQNSRPTALSPFAAASVESNLKSAAAQTTFIPADP